MRVLVIKTSSLGDVIHTLPAVTDAAARIAGIRFDWVVEESFAEIPAWHPAVERVLPVALRRWRKNPWRAWRSGDWSGFRRALSQYRYDRVIDAQGLLKSAFITRFADGPSYGLDRQSAREPLASRFYDHPLPVTKGRHAIERTRSLFAQVLDYELGGEPLNYGLDPSRLPESPYPSPYLVYLHGTTWLSKHYPETHWQRLVALAEDAGYRVLLPWGNPEERQRAQRLAATRKTVEVLPALELSRLAGVLAGAAGVVGVDTGLAHLASALERPGVFLYGPTDVTLTGVAGPAQRAMQADLDCVPCLKRRCSRPEASAGEPVCLQRIDPEVVFSALQEFIPPAL
ncbi:MAG: lipopolysaccharide heptosyltransferase I [Candidatus Thiodiazotropha sp.]|jgi:heptosyltransferase I